MTTGEIILVAFILIIVVALTILCLNNKGTKNYVKISQ